MYRPTFLGKTSDFLQIVCFVILWMVPRAMGLGWFFPVPNNYTTTPEPFRPYPVLRPFVGLPAASATSTPRASRPKKSRASPYDYEELLDKSIMFYEAQRSGRLPFGRRVRWRKDSALRDRGLFGEDLTGGWYDAGDHVKFGLPMASATTVLLWGFIDYYDSYKDSGLEDAMFDCVKWPLDYFMKAHTKTFEFYAQVGDPKVDHTVWCRPEDLTMNRPGFRVTKTAPGSDVVGETAAALAAGAIAFNKTDKYYSRRLLRHAEQLFQFADKYRGKYSDHVPAKDSYPSTDYKDELVWAALWLFKATGDKDYLEYAEKNYREGPAWAFCWDEKWAGAQILLYKFTRKRRYRTDIIRTLQAWQPGGSVKYTPKGLAIRYEWGPLRYASNMAFIALEAADAGIFRWWYRRWATKQIHYALGSTGKSFVVGYGENPPQRPHHAASSCRPIPWPCSWDDYSNEGPNPIILYGALVGGPDINDRYTDNRTDYLHNEVTCDYNAGFQSSIAALRQIYKSDYS